MNRALLRHGFILVLLSLVSGLFVPLMTIPRLGLSAHTIGVLGGALVIGVALAWPAFSLGPRQRQWLAASWLYSSYVNWLACLVGAVLGAGGLAPLATAGARGTDVAEGLVTVLLVTVGLSSFLAVGLSLWGLRDAGAKA